MSLTEYALTLFLCGISLVDIRFHSKLEAKNMEIYVNRFLKIEKVERINFKNIISRHCLLSNILFSSYYVHYVLCKWVRLL